MDFKVNIEEVATICNKMDSNTSALLQEISKSIKSVQDLHIIWKDDGSKIFIEKFSELMKSLQSLAKVYDNISRETKKSLDKYEEIDSSMANMNTPLPLIPVYPHNPEHKGVYYSKKLGGEYYVARFNESTGKVEYYPAPADFGKNKMMYDGDGGKLVIRKVNEKTGKIEYIDSPTQTIPEEDLIMVAAVSNSPIMEKSENLYIKWFNESTGEYEYHLAPKDFENGDISFKGGAGLVKLNDKGEYEDVLPSPNNTKKVGGK